MPKCPHCDGLLSERESRQPNCMLCHQPLAARPVTAQPAATSRPAAAVPVTPPPVGAAAPPPSATTAANSPPRATMGGILLAIGVAILGIIVTLLIDGGRATWIWLGGGIGAGVGAMIAQAAGMWPKRSARS